MIKQVGALLALSLVGAQPAAAASDYRASEASAHRPAAFGGFTVRVPLGERAAAKPEARLQLTTYRMNPREPAALRTFNRKGLELGATKSGQPLLFSGGQNTAEVQRKLGLDKTATLLVVGGVILAVVIVAAIVSAAPTPGPDEGAFD